MLGGLIKGDGKAELNWTNEYLFVESNFNIFDGLITTQTDFLARWENQFELYLFGEAKVLMPHFVPLWGGTKLSNAEVFFQYTDDGDYSNDYIAAWGKTWFVTTGIQVSLDGNWHSMSHHQAKKIADHAKSIFKNIDFELSQPKEIGDDLVPAPIVLAPTIPAQTIPAATIPPQNIPQQTIPAPTLPAPTIPAPTIPKPDRIIEGTNGNDDIYGNNQNNRLEGGTGNDTLNGGAGNDRLIGEAGEDIVTGGSDADRFVFRFLEDAADGGDIMKDFNYAQGDRIEIYRATTFNNPHFSQFKFGSDIPTGVGAGPNDLYFRDTDENYHKIATLEGVDVFNSQTHILIL